MKDLLTTPTVSYEVVAGEYYNLERHPTCANFRSASGILFRRWLSFFSLPSHICEVGAGKSLLAEILLEQCRSLHSLMLVDESPAMLAHSETYRGAGAVLYIASASALPHPSRTVDWVVSCLGDPYNSESFWREAYRVLKNNGTCFFTTPSYDWAQAFRSAIDPDSMHDAEFELADGSCVSLPSHIYSQEQQIRMIESAGLRVSDVASVSISEISQHLLSPKLIQTRGLTASVATGYVASKP